MRIDQNRIELQTKNGLYEECILDANDDQTILPGSLVELREGATSLNVGNPNPTNVYGFDAAVILENALIGTGIHAQQNTNKTLLDNFPPNLDSSAREWVSDTILCRRLVAGDVYLIRAVPGYYYSGQPLYATQTAKGIYVTSQKTGMFIGWAGETYNITSSMCDLIDDSTSNRPSSTRVNGVLVNLLRVQIGSGNRSVGQRGDLISYTATANGDSSTKTTQITISFGSAPAELTKENFAISPSAIATLTGVTKIDSKTYVLDVDVKKSGSVNLVCYSSGVDNTTHGVSLYGLPEPTKLSSPSILIVETGDDFVTIGGLLNPDTDTYTITYTSKGVTKSVTVTPNEDGEATISDLTQFTTYSIKAKANGDGESYTDSDWSFPVSATTTGVEPLPTPVPTGLNAPRYLDISWNPVPNALSYFLRYSQTTDFTGASVIPVDGTSYHIADLLPQQTYYVEVKAVGDGDDYSDSAWGRLIISTTAQTNQLSTPPITAEDVTKTSVTISNIEVENAVSYQLRYGTSSNLKSVTPQTITPSNNSFVVTGLTPNTTYYFEVKAIADGIDYIDSAWASISQKTEAIPTLTAPTISATSSKTEIVVSGIESENATNYQIRYGTTPNLTSVVPLTITPDDGTHTLSSLTPNTTYYIEVRAKGDGTNYLDSEWVSLSKTTEDYIVLDTPSISAFPSKHSVTLSGINVDNASSYQLRYGTSSNLSSATPQTITPTDGSYTISDLTADTAYYFEVKAVGDNIDYLDSNWGSASAKTTTIPALTTPSLSISDVTRTSLVLNGIEVENAQGYKLRYGKDSDLSSYVSSNILPSDGSYPIYNLDPDTTYYFEVMALGDNIEYLDSNWGSISQKTEAIPTLATPTIDAVADIRTILISGINVENASSYQLRYGTSSDLSSVTPQTITPFKSLYTLNDLTPDTTYYIEVRAVGDGTNYLDSNWASISRKTEEIPTLSTPTPTTSATNTTIVLSDIEVDNASSYQIRYGTSADLSSVTPTTMTITGGTYTISSLTPDTTYYIEVKAVGDGTNYLDSNWASLSQATTNAPSLSTPTISTKSFDASSATIGGLTNTDAKGWILRYALSPDDLSDEDGEEVTPNAQGEVSLTDLTQGVTYYVQAKAIGDHINYNDSEWSNTLTITPSEQLDTPSITVADIADTQFTISDFTVDNASSYKLKISLTEQGLSSATEVSIIPDVDGEAIIPNRDPSTTYYITAKAIGDGTSYTDSEWSNPVQVTTIAPIEKVTFDAASANGTDIVSTNEIILTLSGAPVKPLTLKQISVSPSDLVTLVSLGEPQEGENDTVTYKLTVVSSDVGTATIQINNPSVSDDQRTALIWFTSIDLPEGFWGVTYDIDNDSGVPTGAEILNLSSSHFTDDPAEDGEGVLRGDKRNLSLTFNRSYEDWLAAGGEGDEDYFNKHATGRAFVLTQSWGNIKKALQTDTFDVTADFAYQSVNIGGVTFSGPVAIDPYCEDGVEVDFQFLNE